MAAICTWFRMAGLAAIVWIPAFAGMTVGNAGMTGGNAGMTGEKSGMTERGRPARRAALARRSSPAVALKTQNGLSFASGSADKSDIDNGEKTAMTPSQEIEARVVRQLESLGVEYEMFEIDPDFADTAAFCERYGFPPENSGNTIVVASKRGAKKHCACIVAATDRLDVNKRVKRLMGVSRASFAGADETAELTGMMIGGVTPFGLPSDLPIYADAKLKGLDYVILGGGSRSSKIKAPPAELEKLPNLEFVDGLSLG